MRWKATLKVNKWGTYISIALVSGFFVWLLITNGISIDIKLKKILIAGLICFNSLNAEEDNLMKPTTSVIQIQMSPSFGYRLI